MTEAAAADVVDKILEATAAAAASAINLENMRMKGFVALHLTAAAAAG